MAGRPEDTEQEQGMSERTREIRKVLLEARDNPNYAIGSPAAIDHLLVHVVALIDELQLLEDEGLAARNRSTLNDMARRNGL